MRIGLETHSLCRKTRVEEQIYFVLQKEKKKKKKERFICVKKKERDLFIIFLCSILIILNKIDTEIINYNKLQLYKEDQVNMSYTIQDILKLFTKKRIINKNT